jgi:hypothetical protein
MHQKAVLKISVAGHVEFEWISLHQMPVHDYTHAIIVPWWNNAYEQHPQLFHLVLCNRYGLPTAARSLGEFQEASEAPVSMAILAERATRKFAQRTAARRVELKMARRLRCSSITGRGGHAPSSRLRGGPF